jgi:hypothetical protein
MKIKKCKENKNDNYKKKKLQNNKKIDLNKIFGNIKRKLSQ